MTTRVFLAFLLMAMLPSGCSTGSRESASLTQRQAQVLAEKLAFEKYPRTFGGVAPQQSNLPQFDSGHWVWVWRRGSFSGDTEITVSFGPDGSSPVVNSQTTSSYEPVRRR
jgi:hypothetical protein